MSRRAIFPGSFDPITKGHVDILKRALPLFDQIVVAIGENSAKKYFFPLAQRINFLKELFADEPKIEVNAYNGLTTDFCKTENANYILRGIRSSADFGYERTIAQFNSQLNNEVESIFLISSPEYAYLSSSVVREILKHKGDVSPFVPEIIVSKITDFKQA